MIGKNARLAVRRVVTHGHLRLLLTVRPRQGNLDAAILVDEARSADPFPCYASMRLGGPHIVEGAHSPLVLSHTASAAIVRDENFAVPAKDALARPMSRAVGAAAAIHVGRHDRGRGRDLRPLGSMTTRSTPRLRPTPVRHPSDTRPTPVRTPARRRDTVTEAQELTPLAQESVAAAKFVLDQILAATDVPDSFSLLGRQWSYHPEVFPGTLTGATEVMATILPYPQGGSFLEVGCGTGVIAVTAALSGASRVAALDINPKAVANARDNAVRHGVADRVTVVESDLFAALDPDERFDTIFWNVPWTWTEKAFEFESDLYASVFDRGYEGHRRYITEGASRLTPEGRLLIGTADLGERPMIDAFAASAGLTVRLVDKVRRIESFRVMEYHLLELSPSTP